LNNKKKSYEVKGKTSGLKDVYSGRHSSVLDSNGPCVNICTNQQRDPQEMPDVINHVIDHLTELLSRDKDTE